MEKFKYIDLIVFDLDGTICKLDVDWNGLKKELRDFLLKTYGVEIDFSRLNEGLERVEKLLGKKAKEEAYSIVERYELKNIQKLKPIKKTLELIKLLKSDDKQLAIFSSNLKVTIEKALEILGIKDCFQTIVAKEDVKRLKPSTEGLEKILKIHKLPKEKAIYIGDEKDLEIGLKAGIKILLVSEL